MKAEELLTRAQDEKVESFDPPLFECRFTAVGEPSRNQVWKLQSASRVIELFPWAKSFIVGSGGYLEIKVLNGHEYTLIKQVA